MYNKNDDIDDLKLLVSAKARTNEWTNEWWWLRDAADDTDDDAVADEWR